MQKRFDLDLEFKYPIRPLRSPLDKINQIYSLRNINNINMNGNRGMKEEDRREEALKLLKSKHQSVFPLLKSESITMLIFSFVDVFFKSIDLLKKLNSYGYDIYALRLHLYKHKFELYLKSETLCNSIKSFNEEEVFT